MHEMHVFPVLLGSSPWSLPGKLPAIDALTWSATQNP